MTKACCCKWMGGKVLVAERDAKGQESVESTPRAVVQEKGQRARVVCWLVRVAVQYKYGVRRP